MNKETVGSLEDRTVDLLAPLMTDYGVANFKNGSEIYFTLPQLTAMVEQLAQTSDDVTGKAGELVITDEMIIAACSEIYCTDHEKDEQTYDIAVGRAVLALVSASAMPSAASVPEEMADTMEDPIMVPRGLIGAACYVLRKHDPESKTLAQLRALTFAAAPAPQGEANPGEFVPGMNDFGSEQ